MLPIYYGLQTGISILKYASADSGTESDLRFRLSGECILKHSSSVLEGDYKGIKPYEQMLSCAE